MSYQYEYPRPAVTVDCLVFFLSEEHLKILLIKRKQDPYKGRWAFPGGFMDIDEAPEDAAVRELEEETGVSWHEFEQVGAFGKVDRDPRGRTVSVAYMGFVDEEKHTAGSDAAEAQWFNITDLPSMAFDHAAIFATAMEKMHMRLAAKSDQNHSPFGLKINDATKVLSMIKKEPWKR